MARFDLTNFEKSVIQPLLPNKPRGVPRVDDRRVLNGIFWPGRLGGYPVALWPSYDLREPLQPMAQGGGVGPSFGRCIRSLPRRHPDDRFLLYPRSSACRER